MATWEREEKLWHSGYTLVGGCDEVGRGPLAGPVVAAIVVFDRACLENLADSKILSAKRRLELNREIVRCALAVGIGVVDNGTIDTINILNATKVAMSQAWRNLRMKPDYLLVDALEPEDLAARVKLEGLIKGDSLCASIAAASIVAKVYRDRLMVWYHKTYPQYNFYKNKGYPTREHYQALQKYGCCPLHRRSFRGVVNE
ncbi:MAG TPA: ribonuclease HII [Firmicutes bacterium]|jgi:ribonuclease HII|nr:ribonuclease HII [Bacillota bacterium]HBS92403.1 ribonuclease HII [Bacillota bacterium]HCX79221.1 ribonuclease HII [Bacillota bacterium]